MRHQPSLHEQALGQRNSAELLAGRGESDVLTGRHARWYARLAEPADFLQHTDCPRFWPVLEIEIENLRAAARWAIDHEPCPGARPPVVGGASPTLGLIRSRQGGPRAEGEWRPGSAAAAYRPLSTEPTYRR